METFISDSKPAGRELLFASSGLTQNIRLFHSSINYDQYSAPNVL